MSAITRWLLSHYVYKLEIRRAPLLPDSQPGFNEYRHMDVLPPGGLLYHRSAAELVLTMLQDHHFLNAH